MPRNINVTQPITPLPPQGYWPDLLDQVYSNATLKAPVGFRIADNMGRVFRLVKTTEAVTVGNMMTNLVTEVAIASTKWDLEPVGESTINVDVTATAGAYDNGLLLVTDGAGAGYMYPIVHNTAGTAGSVDCVVTIEGKIVVATSASTTVGMMRSSPFWNVSQHNAANPCVEAAVGRCMATTSASYPYCWAQTWGPCLVCAGAGAVGAGDTIGLAEDDAGSVQTLVTTEDPALCGVSYQAIADTKWGLVNLMIFP